MPATMFPAWVLLGQAEPALDVFQILMQAGALGILAYHILVGLPKMIEGINATQLKVVQMMADNAKEERREFARRSDKIVDAIENQTDRINEMSGKLDNAVLVMGKHIHVTGSEQPRQREGPADRPDR